MYMYNYIINHLRVFTHGHHGSQPAPTPYPPEQVCVVNFFFSFVVFIFIYSIDNLII